MHLDFEDLFDPVWHWFEDWPFKSGNSAFPVPGELGESAVKAFYSAMDNNSMWDGPYGDRRKELLAYIDQRCHFAAYVN